MCGLIGILGNKNLEKNQAKEFILDQYDAQSSRGTKGFGLIKINLLIFVKWV